MRMLELFAGIGEEKHIYTCQGCGEIFKSYNPNPKFCSRACKDTCQIADIDTRKAISMYLSGMTQQEVAEALGVTQKVIHTMLKREGIKTRKAAKRNQTGESNHMWKGGRVIDGGGYVLIKKHDHTRRKKAGQYVPEHVLVMEKHLGRKLNWFGPGHPDSEIVHHINGDKKDNRIENLMIVNFVEHMKIHNKLRKKGGDANGQLKDA